jgi:uncharacterized membrane protein
MTSTNDPTAPNPTPPASDDPTQSNQQIKIIPQGLDAALRTAGLNPDDPKLTKAIEISLMVKGSLPLMPPPMLTEYAKIFPGLAERIVGWTEQQHTHRQSLERQQTVGSETRMNRSQLITGGVAIWGLMMAAIAGIWGATAVGIAIAVVSIGGPTAAIWLARNTGANKPKLAPKTVLQNRPEAADQANLSPEERHNQTETLRP